MRQKVGGLYRTNCGSVVSFNESPSHGHVLASNGCRDRRCNSGDWWSYDRNGKWDGRQEEVDFHLHLKEEIKP